jgi:hypothetical protein
MAVKLVLREEHRLRMFTNRVLRGILDLKESNRIMERRFIICTQHLTLSWLLSQGRLNKKT